MPNETDKVQGLEEFLRQVGNQSALLAGFAFVGLTSFSPNIEALRPLQLAFVICSSVVIGLELLTLFVTGLLGFTIKLNRGENEWWYTYGSSAWFFHFSGMQAFLASLSMFVWIRWRPVAIPVLVLCVAASVSMVLYLIGREME